MPDLPIIVFYALGVSAICLAVLGALARIPVINRSVRRMLDKSLFALFPLLLLLCCVSRGVSRVAVIIMVIIIIAYIGGLL